MPGLPAPLLALLVALALALGACGGDDSGPTDTEFFDRGELTDTRMGATSMKDDPADVARQGFEGLMEGKERVEAGSLATKIQGRVSRLIPDSVKAAAHSKMAEPGSAKE